MPSADLRQARRKQQEPVTDRARQSLQIEQENRSRLGLRRTLGHLWRVVRSQAQSGMERFKEQFQQVSAGVAAFRERFQAHQAEQAVQKEQEARDLQHQNELKAREPERAAGSGHGTQHPPDLEQSQSRGRSRGGGMRQPISRPAPELDGPELEMD